MADLECDVLLQAIDITIDCSVVPSCGDNKLDSGIDVVDCIQQMIELVIEPA